MLPQNGYSTDSADAVRETRELAKEIRRQNFLLAEEIESRDRLTAAIEEQNRINMALLELNGYSKTEDGEIRKVRKPDYQTSVQPGSYNMGTVPSTTRGK